MKSLKPLPCPFCAHPGTFRKETDGWTVGCPDTRFTCLAPRSVTFDVKADALLEWNTRHRVPQKPGPTIAQLKADLVSIDKKIAARKAFLAERDKKQSAQQHQPRRRKSA